MSYECKDIDGKLLDFLYDELAPEDKEAFSAHLAACPRCQREVDALRGVRQAASQLPLIEPSPRVSDAILLAAGQRKAGRQIERGERGEGGKVLVFMRRMVHHPAYAMAAAFIVVGGVAGWQLLRHGHLTEAPPRLPVEAKTEPAAPEPGVHAENLAPPAALPVAPLAAAPAGATTAAPDGVARAGHVSSRATGTLGVRGTPTTKAQGSKLDDAVMAHQAEKPARMPEQSEKKERASAIRTDDSLAQPSDYAPPRQAMEAQRMAPLATASAGAGGIGAIPSRPAAKARRSETMHDEASAPAAAAPVAKGFTEDARDLRPAADIALDDLIRQGKCDAPRGLGEDRLQLAYARCERKLGRIDAARLRLQNLSRHAPQLAVEIRRELELLK